MVIKKIMAGAAAFPELLSQIPDPPKQLYVLGDSLETLLARPRLAVVGSRKASPYGLHVTHSLTRELAEQGMVIVSGLALGIDGAAHQAALEAGGLTIAVLPCGLDRIYPSTNRSLALKILEKGGALVSEYPEATEPRKENFIARNRLISGLSDGVLIPEAAAKSGSLHTAGFALEQGRAVMAVPGNITSLNSAGTNNLIKTGATPIHRTEDVLAALGLEQLTKQAKEVIGGNAEEQAVLQLLSHGISDADELCALSQLEAALFNQTLTMLEISGKIRPIGAGHWTLR
jgi:DNA processing protein